MIYALLCIFIASATQAKDGVDVRSLADGETAPSAMLDDIRWLAGYWVGEGLGGQSADLIAPPAGGQMMGAFRQLKTDGAPHFYEFYLFAEENDSIVLRLKHFTPEMIGWEEKAEYVEFPLVSIEERAVYFDGVTFAMTSELEMQAAAMVEGQGVIRFNYARAVLP